MAHRKHRWKLIILCVALVALVWVIYEVDYRSAFHVRMGNAVSLETDPLDFVSGRPVVFEKTGAPNRLVVTFGSPTGQDSMQLLDFDLGNMTHTVTKGDPFSDSGLAMIQLSHQHYSGDEEAGAIVSPTGTYVVKQTFSGIRLRLPYYRLSGYPDASGPGFVWRYFVAGKIRIELSRVDSDAVIADVEQSLIGAHYLMNLAELGAWTGDGRHFVILPIHWNQDIIVMTAEKIG